MTDSLIASVCRTVEQHGLFAAGQTVVVGVSGGPDSTALLHALSRLREEWGISLVVAHLNHGFRGAEAEEEADYVAELSARLSLPCHSERVDVPAVRRAERLSAQEAAREVRHGFLRRVAAEVGAERIALGHTRDDRIETVLLNLLRGTGPEGLSGMPPKRLPLVRPLYDVGRVETEAYCAANHLQPRIDSSNLKTDYARNRLRAELLPHLVAYYNARVGDAVLRMSEVVSADNHFLEALASESLKEAALTRSGDRIVLRAATLQELPLALRRRVLRQAVAEVRGHLHGLGFEVLEGALQALAEGRQQEITLPSRTPPRVHLRTGEAEVTVFRETPASTFAPWRRLLAIPGETELPEAGLYAAAILCANFSDLKTVLKSIPAGRIAELEDEDLRWGNALVFRTGEITLPILVRSWQAGDRIRPRNLGGRKKLQDLFTDCKVRANERGRFPVLVDAGGNGRILAVVPLQTDETALSTPQSEGSDKETPEGGFLALTFGQR